MRCAPEAQSSSRASRRASSICRSSSWLTRPTRSPRRSGATAAVCSTRTCVSTSSTMIVGRNDRGAAEREVGATSRVDSSRSSDWTITQYRAPCCSRPRVERGARSRWMSPRTELVHRGEHSPALLTVRWIVQQRLGLCTHPFSSAEANRVDERLADCVRSRGPIRHQFGERRFGTLIGAEVHDSHSRKHTTGRKTKRLRPPLRTPSAMPAEVSKLRLTPIVTPGVTPALSADWPVTRAFGRSWGGKRNPPRSAVAVQSRVAHRCPLGCKL